ncbi:MAG TPA: hypothetical protein VG323_13800 [Thermoanaerobaculia bacterium]|nr:hypothetical protein [Thermoanaerobaculia bacterium]
MTSASAEERHRDGTWRDNSTYRDNNSRRDNNTRRDNSTYRNNSSYRNNGSYRDNNNYRNNGSYRDSRSYSNRNDRFNEHGRISRFTRERDGYRVWLGGERSYWIPSYRLGGRRLRLGLDISLGGIFSGGYWQVDALGWPGDPYYAGPYYGDGSYSDGVLSGIVERVDFRYGSLLLRDARSGRVFNVDMRSTGLADFRPGDRITLEGSWEGGGLFRAYRIDDVRPY